MVAARPVPGVPSADWRADLRAVAEAHWRAIRAHPDVIPLILTRRSLDPATLAAGEDLLAVLARSGRSGAALLAAFRTVNAFVHGFAQGELASPLSAGPGEDPEVVLKRVRALPPDRYPRLIEIAGAAAGSGPEAEFRAGLDVLVAGLDPHAT
jgi:hypothetical protein